MNILIRTAGGVPIYEQIFTQLRDEICSGALPPGEALPSIRSLARDLRVSVITTKRAYEELERAGTAVRSSKTTSARSPRVRSWPNARISVRSPSSARWQSC